MTFKGVTGIMTPQCLCTDHSISKDKRHFDLTDMDPVSSLVSFLVDVDKFGSAHGSVALYSRHYKRTLNRPDRYRANNRSVC